MTDKPRDIFIGIPAHDHKVSIPTLNSLIAGVYELAQGGMTMTLFCWSGDSLLCHARNVLLAKFLESDSSDFVFVDSDIAWEPGALRKMVEQPVDFVAGVYRKKLDDEGYPVNYLNNAELWADPETGLLELADIPIGFTRLSRKAVEQMTEAAKDRPFRHHNAPDLQCHVIFDNEYERGGGDNGQFFGEDYVFCRKWRALGGKVWSDPYLKLTHCGAKDYVGTFGEWLRSRPHIGPELTRGISGRMWPQHVPEVEKFAALLKEKGVKKYLEIGCRYGDTWSYVMSVLGENATGVALDWPGVDGYESDGLGVLKKTVETYGGKLVIGNSREQKIIDIVRELGPYDAILIDGDHSYDGVLADWLNYGDMAPIVVFHDVVNPGEGIGVPKLWAELAPDHDHVKIIADGSYMGFGALFRDAAEQKVAAE